MSVMESNLKSQLKNLKSQQKPDPILPKNTDSTFLFDFKDSRRVDTDTVYELGYNGIIELSRLEAKLIDYIPKLFSSTSKYHNRQTKTDEENKTLDTVVNKFIVELVPYFLTKHVHKIMEYLIKIFKVNVYNGKVLCLAFLPYHESKYYAKLIQNVNLESIKNLGFLSTFAKNGIVVLHDSLMKEFANFDFLMEVFTFYENYIVNTGYKYDEEYSRAINPNVYFDFLQDAFKSMLKATGRSNENLLNLVVKFIYFNLKGFKNEESDWLKIPQLCQVVVILCTKFYISKDYKAALVNDLLMTMTKTDNKNVLERVIQTVLIILTNANEDISLNKNTLSEIYSFYYELSSLKSTFESISRSYDLSPLILAFLRSGKGDDCVALINSMFKSLNLTQDGFNKIMDYLFLSGEANELIEYISQIRGDSLNAYILHNITTCGSDKDKISRIKNVMAGMNGGVYEGDFDLLLNINSSYTANVLVSIKKLDEEVGKQNTLLVDYIIPSVAFKFDTNAPEIVLKEILNMNNISKILNTYTSVRLAVILLMNRIIEQDIQIYSHDFITALIKTILSTCLIRDVLSLKTVIYLTIFIDNKNLNDMVRETGGDIVKNTLKILKAKSLNFETLTKLITSQRSFIKEFYKIMYRLLTSVSKDKCLPYYPSIIKLTTAVSAVKVYKSISVIIIILKIKGLDESLYRHFIGLITGLIPQNYINQNMFEFSTLLITTCTKSLTDGYFDIVRGAINKYFQSNSGVFIAHMLLADPTRVKQTLELVEGDNADSSLIIVLAYLLSNCGDPAIFTALDKLKAKKPLGNDFNSLFIRTGVYHESKIDLDKFITELLDNKNEITTNANNLKKVINNSKYVNSSFYILLNKLYVVNITKHSYVAGIGRIMALFNDKLYKFTNNQHNEVIETILPVIENADINTNEHALDLVAMTLMTLIKSDKNNLEQILKLIIAKDGVVFPKRLVEFVITNLTHYKFTKPNLSLFFDTIGLAIKYAISSELFSGVNISYVDLLDAMLISPQKDTVVSYAFDIIINNNNAYFTDDYIVKTLSIVSSISSTSETIYLTLCNNLLTLISNSTIDVSVSAVMKGIEGEILRTIKEAFSQMALDGDDTNMTGCTLNVLFLSLNAVIRKEPLANKVIVKDLIVKCFESLDLRLDANREICLTLIKSIQNFIELLFNDKGGLLKEADYFDYIHYFIKYSIQFIHNNGIVEEFLFSFMKLIMYSEKLTTYFLLELGYFYNHVEGVKSKVKDLNIYNHSAVSTASPSDALNRLLIMIDFTLCEIDKSFKDVANIFDKDDKARRVTNAVVLLDQLVSINESLFFEKNISVNNSVITNICASLSSIFKHRSHEKAIKLIEDFQDYLFDLLSESKIIHTCVLLIYENYSQEARNYFLLKYYDILITNEHLGKGDANARIFEYLLDNYVNEKHNENLQIVFSILTKLVSSEKSYSDYIDSNKTLTKLLAFLKTKDSGITRFSILVFLAKVYTNFETKYLDTFNNFMDIFVTEMSGVSNPELAGLVIQTLYYLTSKMSDYLSPKLNDLVLTLLQVNTVFKTITPLAGQVLTNLAQKQLFDNVFLCVKHCLKNKDKFNEDSFALLMEFLKTSLKISDKLTVANLYQKLFKFFVKILLDKGLANKSITILEAYQTFMLKINEKQLKQIFSDLISFATEEREEPDSFKYILENCVVSFELLNMILKTINGLFVSYFENYKNYTLELITYLNATFSSHNNDNKKKKSRQFFEEAYDGDNKFSYLNLNSLILENIKLNFQFNQDKLLYDTVEELFEPVTNQVYISS
jgi:hypothetical protein